MVTRRKGLRRELWTTCQRPGARGTRAALASASRHLRPGGRGPLQRATASRGAVDRHFRCSFEHSDNPNGNRVGRGRRQGCGGGPPYFRTDRIWREPRRRTADSPARTRDSCVLGSARLAGNRHGKPPTAQAAGKAEGGRIVIVRSRREASDIGEVRETNAFAVAAFPPMVRQAQLQALHRGRFRHRTPQ